MPPLIDRMNKHISVRMVAVATVVASAMVLVGVLGGSPAQAACTGASSPQFNPFNIAFGSINPGDCNDYIGIDAKLVNDGGYSKSMSDWINGLKVQAGDEAYVSLYIHNGATPKSDGSNTMHNVRIMTGVPTGTSNTFSISTTYLADNARAFSPANFTITSDSNVRLEVVPKSGELFRYDNSFIKGGLNVGNNTYSLGDLQACFDNSVFLRFKVRVVGTIAPTPTPAPTSNPQPTVTPTQTQTPTPNAALVSPYCNLGSATPAGYQSRTLIRFRKGINDPSNYWMSSVTSANRRTQETATTSLAAGTYRVILGSFDDHAGHGGQGQQREQYYLELKDNNGNLVAKTGNSNDIPDGQNYLKTVVPGTVVLGSAVSKVIPAHSAYPDNSSHNSLTAVCAAFDKLGGNPDLTPTLTISKNVRNITQGSGEADSVSANPNDTVEFVIRVGNTGTGNATNTIVSDVLPSLLKYVAGSTTVDGSSMGNGIVTSSGINIGTVTAGQTLVIRFRAQVASENNFPVGTTSLTNIGYASADAVAQINDSATVQITKGQNPVTCSPHSQTALTNQTANFSATGGTGTYAWSAGGGNPSSGNGTTFSTAYNAPGTWTVTLTSGTATDTCSVTVNNNNALALTITKRVWNVTQNNGEADVVSAHPSDVVEFVLRVQNTGTVSATNVIISDTLPTLLTYMNGTTTLDGLTYNDGITSNGLNIGTLTTNQLRTIRFRAQVADTGSFGSGTTTLTNIGYARADNVAQVHDSASVQVTRNSQLTCSPSTQNVGINTSAYFSVSGGNGNYSWYAPNGLPSSGAGSTFAAQYGNTGTYTVSVNDTAGNYSSCTVYVNTSSNVLSLSKMVRNMTQNSSEVDSVNANSNDTVEFVLRVTVNDNTSVQNIRVTDSLPAGLRYINGSTRVDGVSYSDGITSSGINIGSYTGSRTIVVRFQAQVESDSYFGTGSTTLTNIGYTRADNYSMIQDSAYVVVNRGGNGSGQLTIEKFGKNVSRGENDNRTGVIAYPGNTIEFVLKVRNTSNTTLNNVLVRDTLPAGLTYINHTTSLNNNIVADGVVSSGINIGTLAPYQEAIIKFDVTVNDRYYFQQGTTYLTNVAYARADNTPEVSATLPISLVNGSTIIPATRVQTGSDSLVISLLVAVLMTLVYLAYSKTNLFKTREAVGVMNRMSNDSNRFNFVK